MVVGLKTNLIYQESTNTSDGQGGYTTSWRDIMTFRGNLMEAINEAGLEKFTNDKKSNWVEYFFIIDRPLRTTISNTGRFYQKSTGIYYEIRDIDNLAFQNRILEIRLRKIL